MSVGGRVGRERRGRGFAPPSRPAPDGDKKYCWGVRGAAEKTRARPEGERNENVDPMGVEVDAAVDFAGAAFTPGSDPGNEVENEARVILVGHDGSWTGSGFLLVDRVWEGNRWRKRGSPIELMDERWRATE